MTVNIKPPVVLNPCPFCGGDAEMKLSSSVMQNAVRISCTQCHSASGSFTEGRTVAFKDIPSRYVTLDECIRSAVMMWNRRIEEDVSLVEVKDKCPSPVIRKRREQEGE